MRYSVLIFLVGAALSSIPARSDAQKAEYVLVKKLMENDDKGIVTRANGEEYLIEKGVGCLSFWRFEGKRVLVTYSGVFGGVGSRLVLPDVDQSCRLWTVEQLTTTATPTTIDAESSSDIAVALQLLGFSAQTSLSAAIATFQRSSRITANGVAGSETRVALSKALADSFPRNLVALQLAVRLLRSPREGTCEEGHWIQSVSSDGETVKLEDGSLWQVDAIGRIYTMLWLPVQKVMVCGSTFIHLPSGRRVQVLRLR